MQPKVLVSHASEDRERFVRGFAQRLRSNSIDAWVDPWEMHPDDSLVAKVFGEDINETSAIIVVLSNNSINKPWVTEEIDDRFIRLINRSSLILPVVIDDCPVPDVLKPSRTIRINNLTQYDAELHKITDEIPGVAETESLTNTTLEELIFQHSCHQYIHRNGESISSDAVFASLGSHQTTKNRFARSLQSLKQKFLIESLSLGRSAPQSYAITHFGLEQFLTQSLSTYDEVTGDVIATIVYKEALDSFHIAQMLNQPLPIVNHILEKLHGQGKIHITKPTSGAIEIKSITALLRQHL